MSLLKKIGKTLVPRIIRIHKIGMKRGFKKGVAKKVMSRLGKVKTDKLRIRMLAEAVGVPTAGIVGYKKFKRKSACPEGSKALGKKQCVVFLRKGKKK